MSKYRVYLQTTASHSVEVEAGSPEEAEEVALDGPKPYFPGGMDGELDDWEVLDNEDGIVLIDGDSE